MNEIDKLRARWNDEPFLARRIELLSRNCVVNPLDLRGISFWGALVLHDLKIPELSDVSYADLSATNFSKMHCRKVNLTGSDFRNAKIKDCNFNGANLQYINASGATFSGCDFERAKLQGGIFTKAVFENCSLKNTSFELGSEGQATVLQNTKFVSCELWGTRLNESVLINCEFDDCLIYQLQNVNWTLKNISSNGAFIGPSRTDEFFQPFDLDIKFEDFFAWQSSITRWYSVPRSSRTIVMQHLLYFKKYVEQTKGIDFSVEAVSVGSKVGVRVTSPRVDELSRVDECLDEYWMATKALSSGHSPDKTNMPIQYQKALAELELEVFSLKKKLELSGLALELNRQQDANSKAALQPFQIVISSNSNSSTKHEQPAEKIMGDKYIVGQAGSVGRDSTAIGNSFKLIHNHFQAEIDLKALAPELATLRSHLRKKAEIIEHDQTIASIALAEKSAREGDSTEVLRFLKEAGKWALDATTEIGTSVASKAIEIALGL